MAYLETRIQDAGPGYFFIWSFQDWREELQKQGQGLGHTAIATCHKLQMLEHKERLVMLHTYGVHAEYLVEVFKNPGTGNHIQPDSEDGYGMTQMIGLYGLVEPYSIVQITITQSGVVKDRKKKCTSKCYCMICEYAVQNHPSMNNHIQTHLRLSLLFTVDSCFTIEHGCTEMWNHGTNEHQITPSQPAVKTKKTKK